MVFCSVKTGSSRRIVVDFETGGIAALVLRSMPFSVMSGIGFIATFGVAILDRVVFASRTGDERAEGKDSHEAA